MTSFALKIIAMISMFFDHFGDAYIGHYSFYNLIGRIAFPIFAFQISEGYLHTKNLKKYFIRLGLFALISQIPFQLFIFKFSKTSELTLNIFFTLFIGLLTIWLNDKYDNFNKQTSQNKPFFIIINITKYLSIILLAYSAHLLNTDYGFFGVIIIYMFYLLRNRKFAMICTFILLCIAKYITKFITSNFHYAYILLCIFTALSSIFIILYNGNQGKKIKYLLYLFYPFHLMLLYFIF